MDYVMTKRELDMLSTCIEKIARLYIKTGDKKAQVNLEEAQRILLLIKDAHQELTK